MFSAEIGNEDEMKSLIVAKAAAAAAACHEMSQGPGTEYSTIVIDRKGDTSIDCSTVCTNANQVP